MFHVAATVKFDEKLKTAVAINVKATNEMLLIVKGMSKLKSMIHVSTVFSNCLEETIEEKIYPSVLDYKSMISLSENLPEEVVNQITPQ